MKLAEGWRTDLDKCPRNESVLLACVYADQDDAWFRGEAICTSDKDEWFWIAGRRVEPEFRPRAWMAIPFVLADDYGT